MTVELKSLLSSQEEKLEESISLVREALFPPVPQLPESYREHPPERESESTGALPHVPGEEHAENPLAYLLEQLIRYAEQNAASTEKIADLLEYRENAAPPTYN